MKNYIDIPISLFAMHQAKSIQKNKAQVCEQKIHRPALYLWHIKD